MVQGALNTEHVKDTTALGPGAGGRRACTVCKARPRHWLLPMQPRSNRPAPQRIQILEAVNFDRDYIIPSTPGGDKK